MAAQSGIALAPDQLWLLARIAEHKGTQSFDELVARLRIAPDHLSTLIERLVVAGMIDPQTLVQ